MAPHAHEDERPCLGDVDCPFHEECVEHWSGICPGTCKWSTWFLSVMIWACVAAAIALFVCLRCEFCLLHRLVCRIADSGRLAAAARLRAPGRPSYEREMSAQATSAAAVVANSPSSTTTQQQTSSAAPGGANLQSLHQVVLARSMSMHENDQQRGRC